MTLRIRHTIRAATIGALLAAAMLFVSLAGPAPAHAAVNATLETVTSTTYCNSANRAITFGASITLSGAYPNGAWVAYRFRYFKVNSAGVRTTAFQGGNWLGPVLVDTWTQSSTFLGAPLVTNSAVHLSGGTVYWAGRLRAEVEIAVWTGSGYVQTGWMYIPEYPNYYPTSTGIEFTRGLSDCLTEWPY